MTADAAEDAADIEARELPPILQEIAEATSVAVALQIAAAFGGTELYIPARPIPSSRLVREIGPESVRQIIAAMGGSVTIIVPLGPMASAVRKRRSIRRLIAAGLSNAAVAREVGCHTKTVQRVRRGCSGLPGKRR